MEKEKIKEGRYKKSNINIIDENNEKFLRYGASNDDDLLNNYCIEILGYKFLEPRFYFNKNNISKEVLDFFKEDKHKKEPFNF